MDQQRRKTELELLYLLFSRHLVQEQASASFIDFQQKNDAKMGENCSESQQPLLEIALHDASTEEFLIEIVTPKKREQKLAVKTATEPPQCPRCRKNAENGFKTHRGGCDVGLKAVFRSIRNVSINTIARLTLHDPSHLKEALVDHL